MSFNPSGVGTTVGPQALYPVIKGTHELTSFQLLAVTNALSVSSSLLLRLSSYEVWQVVLSNAAASTTSTGRLQVPGGVWVAAVTGTTNTAAGTAITVNLLTQESADPSSTPLQTTGVTVSAVGNNCTFISDENVILAVNLVSTAGGAGSITLLFWRLPT